MSIKTTHAEYKEHSMQWQRCRDASNGQDAIHAAATAYLPVLSGQSQSEYDAYKNRSAFYNATGRTISGLQGMLFRKAARVQAASTVAAHFNDVSLSGVPLHLFSLEVVEECLTVGRVGIFVDYPQVDTKMVTAADALTLKLRPMMKIYEAETILNWKRTVVDNAYVLSHLMLQEEVQIPESEFVFKEETQYRVLDLVPSPDKSSTGPVYRVRVFKIVADKEVQVGPDVYPIVAGKKLGYIPFYFISTEGTSCDVEQPPLLDLVNINISHYRTNADYEHGCHFTGLPTPVITGYTPDPAAGGTFGIGSTTAWVFPRTDAKAFFLEFTGTGLKALENNLSRKETQMAVLGARMLENSLATGESGNSAAINLGGEQSTLASIAKAVSLGIEQALNTFSKFAGSNEPVKYELNRDFFPTAMTPLELTALVASWQNGAISYNTLFANLQRGEIMDVDRTIEQELSKMKEHQSIIPAGTQVGQDDKPTHEVTMPTGRQLQTP